MFHEHCVDGGGSSQHFGGKQFARQDGWLMSAEWQSVCIVWPDANNLAKYQQRPAGGARQQSRIIRWDGRRRLAAKAAPKGVPEGRRKGRLRGLQRAIDAGSRSGACGGRLCGCEATLSSGFSRQRAVPHCTQGDSESEMADAG